MDDDLTARLSLAFDLGSLRGSIQAAIIYLRHHDSERALQILQEAMNESDAAKAKREKVTS